MEQSVLGPDPAPTNEKAREKPDRARFGGVPRVKWRVASSRVGVGPTHVMCFSGLLCMCFQYVFHDFVNTS